ncbi:uncharacterized protein LOC105398103 isoform X2 [Plutella xylostella]|uniref:uncharacterized protein LOC105398103 isoform X2 n=1 Tax=Plutella xylostella TaxID=51655 RepID=UPI0020329148|nr:uncharacterized protein LOC105398103 isoform X2 [Plutella xylostella]
MPSCVVKSCRNHSGIKKKCEGITFHRFSKQNDIWRKTWIDIIRDVRGDNNWNPSKSSVICSIHFDANDLYATKEGSLRVVTYAVPKKYLFNPPNIQEHRPDEPKISSVVKEESPNVKEEPLASNLEQPSMSEQSGDPRTSLPSPKVKEDPLALTLEQPSMSEESGDPRTSLHLLPSPKVKEDPLALTLEQPPMSEETGDPRTSLHFLPSPKVKEEALTSNLEQPSMSEQSGCPSLPLLVSQSSSMSEAALCLEQPLITPNSPITSLPPILATSSAPDHQELDFNQPMSILYTHRRMKYDLMKKATLIQKQKRKIKVLNQKGHRS